MKRLPIVLVGLCLALFAAVGSAVVAHGATAARPAAAAAVHTVARDHWCNFVLAGKNATADGSVMMSYNNDWSAGNYQYLQVVPADPATYRFVRILTMGGVPEGGINEYQLGVNYGTATDLDPAVLAADPYVKKGYGGETWDLILQQCRTAPQALDLLAKMASTKGFSSDAAGSFGFGDATQVWVFELLGGHHWVAERVPDNAVLAHPNMLTVRHVDLADTADFRGSSDLESFAQSIGRYDPSSGPFDVAWAYGDRTELQSYYNTNRLWGADNLVAPSLGLTPTMPYATRPVYVVPDHKLTRQDLVAIDRYHYEGTSLDQTSNYTLMSPHAQTDRPICHSTTDYGTVWQLRGWLPAGVGGVVWIAPSRPCSSTFVPFYAGITAVPSDWTGRTAYDAFRAVADSLDKKGKVNGTLRYRYYIPLVRNVYGAYETEVAGAQAATEAAAARLTGTAQSTYLTNYSTQRATQAENLAKSLPAQMP